MAILNFTGFEQGGVRSTNGSDDYQPPTGTGYSIVTTPVRTGTYAFAVNSTGTGVDGNLQFPTTFDADGRANTNAGSYATLYFNFYFRYATKPASLTEEIIGINDTAGALKAVIRIDSAGKLQVYDYNAGTGVYTAVGSLGTTALSANTWYKIGFKLGSGASSAYEIQINDASEVSGTYSWTSTLNNMKGRVGLTNRNNQTVDFYYDDITIKDDAFTSGDCAIKVIKPTANGSTMSWTSGTGASDYQEVDEIPYSDADYVMSPTTGNPNVALFDMQDCTTVGISGTILSFKGVIITRENSTSSSATLIRVYSNTTASDSTTFNGTTQTQGRTRLLNTDPATSSAWTTGGIDAVEVGAVENNAVSVRGLNVMGHVLYQVASTNIKSYNTNLYANIKSIDTNLIANVKSLDTNV